MAPIWAFFKALPELVALANKLVDGVTAMTKALQDNADMKAQMQILEQRDLQRANLLENLRIKTDEQAAAYVKSLAELEHRIGRK